MKIRSAALALAVATVSTTASAQESALFTGNAQHTLVGSNTGETNSASYVQANTSYSGLANLWMRGNTAGNPVLTGCTGNLLWTGLHILTAAHCLSSGTNSIDHRFGTARFRTASGGWQDYNWSSVAIQSGYSGAVLEEQDVAIITLDKAVDNAFERYLLHNGAVLGEKARIGGYGLVGNGITGDAFSSNQFNDDAQLRQGFNLFESTCRDDGFCATVAGTPDSFGGILVADFDRSGRNTNSTLCFFFGFCTAGYSGFEEAAVGRGDSGSGAFSVNTNGIMGVASWGDSFNGGASLSQFGTMFGYACVAGDTGNDVCQANYDFVMRTVAVPEPSSLALLTTSLLALGFAARRRRTAE